MRGIQVKEFGLKLFLGFCYGYVISMICINRFDLLLDLSAFKSFVALVDEALVLLLR
jgi:hypothetical protein